MMSVASTLTMLFDGDKNNKPIEWNRIIIERYLHNYLRARSIRVSCLSAATEDNRAK